MAKKGRGKSGRRSRFAEDAALQAVVRFSPEESGLEALRQQLRSNYKTSVNQAHGTAAGIVAAVRDVTPDVRKVYDQAGLEQARIASVAQPQLAGLSNVADPIRAAVLAETTRGGRQIAEAGAAALTGLSERAVQARQGEQFAVQNARKTFVSDMAKLLERTQSLNREKGAFTAATINALAEKEADRALTRRGQDVSAATTRRGQDVTARGQDLSHADRVAALDAKGREKGPGKTRLPGGARMNTQVQHNDARDKIDRIVAQVKPYADRKVSRHKVAQLFLAGAPADRDEGTQAIKPVDQSWLSYALDLAYDDHLSRRNVADLQRRGYSVGTLGLRGARGTRRARRVSRRTSGAARSIPGLGSTLR